MVVKYQFFSEMVKVQRSIVDTYRDDFNKYSHGNLNRLVQLVFDQLPVMVGRKFKYSHVSRDHRAAELDTAWQQLFMTRDGLSRVAPAQLSLAYSRHSPITTQ